MRAMSELRLWVALSRASPEQVIADGEACAGLDQPGAGRRSEETEGAGKTCQVFWLATRLGIALRTVEDQEMVREVWSP